ncbi:unnamed protein product [Litomosoides sigmodontis]|uniref:Uncharacterized protein n=1 Tax=Litomosoides sigmodontis TaxID=42156 RepID=A0A3P7KD30_LITSI|nr:unnamed protein product [Litomosoides sigmodontis]
MGEYSLLITTFVTCIPVNCMYLIGFATIAAVAMSAGDLVCGYATRQKRQLSPALQLEDSINSILRLNELGYKRSLADRLNEMPTMDLSDSLDDLIALQDIGKRYVLNSNDQFAKQFNVMQHLMRAGKKRSLSPATDFQQQLELSKLLMEVGR